MHALIVSDNSTLLARARDLVKREAIADMTVHCEEFAHAPDRALRHEVELVVLVVPERHREAMDALHEIRQFAPKARIFWMGEASDTRSVLETIQRGADEFLDIAMFDSELSSGLIRWKSKTGVSQPSGRIGRLVSVIGSSGGTGASMLAVNVAGRFAKHYGECGMVDMRWDSADLAPMLDIQPQWTIADLCQRISKLDSAMLEQCVAEHKSGIRLLAAPGWHAGRQAINGKNIRRILSYCRGKYPAVVLDVDNRLGPEHLEALWQSNTILMVIRLDYTSVRNARAMLEQLSDRGVGVENVQLVANSCGQARQLSVRQVEDALHMPVVHQIPFDPRKVHRAINSGCPVIELSPKARIARSIAELADSLNGVAK